MIKHNLLKIIKKVRKEKVKNIREDMEKKLKKKNNHN